MARPVPFIRRMLRAALPRRVPPGAPTAKPAVRGPISHKLARAIEEAARCDDPAEAIAILDAVPKGWRPQTEASDLPPRHLQRLVGVCLRAGLVDDAVSLVLRDVPDSPLPSADAILVDPFHFGPVGHWQSHDRFYLGLMTKAGFSPQLIRTQLSEPPSSDNPPGHAVLPRLFEQRLFRVPATAADLAGLNTVFFEVFGRTLPQHRPALTVVPTAHHIFIEGLARYLAAGAPSEPRALLLGLHEIYWSAETKKVQTVGGMASAASRREPFLAGLALLGELPDLKVLVVGESQPVADGFRAATGGQWETVAGTFVAGDEGDTGQRTRRADGKPTVGFAGRFIPARGSDILAEVIAGTLGRRSDFVWRIRVDRNELKGPPDVIAALQPAVDEGRLEIADAVPEAAAYYRLLRSFDIIAMPYDRSYAIRSSGLTAECLRFGIVMVAPQESTVAQFAEKAGAGIVTFAERTVDAVSRAVNEALDRLPELRERSQRAAARLDDREDLRRVKEFIVEARA